MSEIIKIYIHYDRFKQPLVVSVSKDDLIGSIVPQNERSSFLIYNGEILLFYLSFSFYDITNESHLFKVNISLTINGEQFQRHHQIPIDVYNLYLRTLEQFEEARLLDCLMMKIETNRSCYQKVVQEIYRMETCCYNNINTNIGISPNSPSTEALPPPWFSTPNNNNQ